MEYYLDTKIYYCRKHGLVYLSDMISEEKCYVSYDPDDDRMCTCYDLKDIYKDKKEKLDTDPFIKYIYNDIQDIIKEVGAVYITRTMEDDFVEPFNQWIIFMFYDKKEIPHKIKEYCSKSDDCDINVTCDEEGFYFNYNTFDENYNQYEESHYELPMGTKNILEKVCKKYGDGYLYSVEINDNCDKHEINKFIEELNEPDSYYW